MNAQYIWPTEEEEQQLVAELRTGTPTGKEAIAARYLLLLMHCLEGAFPRENADLRDEAAGRAILDFLSAPDRFDPAQLRLGAYLRMAARCDLRNLLAHERRARRGIPLNSVAEPAERRNDQRDDELTWDDPRLVAEKASFDSTEQIAFELLCDGIHKTPACARRLGLAHLSAEEQAAEVKRMKDRVKRRLIRAVEDSQ